MLPYLYAEESGYGHVIFIGESEVAALDKCVFRCYATNEDVGMIVSNHLKVREEKVINLDLAHQKLLIIVSIRLRLFVRRDSSRYLLNYNREWTSAHHLLRMRMKRD